MPKTVTLGFVGLGTMGSAMAGRLVAADYDVIAFDMVASACDAFVQAGGRAARSVADVAKEAEIIFLSLPTPHVVREVAMGPDGLINSGRPRVVIDLSTTGPAASQDIARALEAGGIGFVDSPVSGGRAGTLAGTLSLMVACSSAAWDEIEPLLKTFGKVFRIGDSAGQAQTMKLINNMLSVVALAATSEGMAMGVKAGLDPKVMLDVLNASSGRNSATTDKFPRAVLPRSFDFGFTTGLSSKDLCLCLEGAEAMGVPMIMGSAARTMLNITRSQFGAQSDFTNMARVVEQWAGVEIRSHAAE